MIRWASNWIPAGSYMANMQNGLSNFSNAAVAKNYKIEYDSDEGGFEGTSIALDLIGLLPAAKGVNIIKIISQIFSTKGTADSIFSSANNDTKIRKFINSLTFSVLGGSENKEEAIIVVEAIAAGALVYDQKGLAKKGIDQNDWAKAVKDQVYGRSNKLYDSVKAGNYD
jgi:hypothetical protein